MKIPGFYDNVPSDTYHSRDWLPEPALSSSGARLIEMECPAIYHWRYLDPAYECEQKKAFDIGGALHLLVLEPHLFKDRTAVVDADDYRTKAAQEAKRAAYAADRVPLLLHELETVADMRDAIFKHPVARLGFVGGVAERSYVWRDPETQILCKARPDYTPGHIRYFIDCKTSTSANPRAFEKRVWDIGYHMQAAWYMDARACIDGERPQRFCFIVVAKDRPHLVTPIWLDDETLAWAQLQNARARRTFARCLDRGEWPGYRDHERPDVDTAFTVMLPPWARRELERQHEAGRFAAPDHLARAEALSVNPFL